jgi:hypothetical protein
VISTVISLLTNCSTTIISLSLLLGMVFPTKPTGTSPGSPWRPP